MVKDKSGERVRIREKESNYIRQIAEQYNESFLDALYRIVNHHRDVNLNNLAKPVIDNSKFILKGSLKKGTNIIDADVDTDIDLDMFA